MHSNVCQALLQGQIVESKSVVSESNPEPKGSLAALNVACWSYSIFDSNGKFVDSVNDLDAIVINTESKQQGMGQDVAPESTILNLIEMDLNLETMRATLFANDGRPLSGEYSIVRNATNERRRSLRSRK